MLIGNLVGGVFRKFSECMALSPENFTRTASHSPYMLKFVCQTLSDTLPGLFNLFLFPGRGLLEVLFFSWVVPFSPPLMSAPLPLFVFSVPRRPVNLFTPSNVFFLFEACFF